jgi:pyrroloquinoline quinone biosynthesis protein B
VRPQLARLTAIVLGSAAGGGYPQWNCRCDVCRLAWTGDPRVRPRTQASLAVTADGESWVLINASPDLPQQIRQTKVLQPRSGRRGSPIKSVLLTGAEIDQVAGLLSLRERAAFTLIATAASLDALAHNPVFDVLAPDLVMRRAAAPGELVALPGGLQAALFPAPGKVPLYLERDLEGDLERNLAATAAETEANVGLEMFAGAARIAYVPGAAGVTAAMLERLAHADVVLFDGTLFRDDEMIRSGTGTKTGRRMGHMPIDGDDGSLAALATIPGRRIFVHINNTNPILVDGSRERVHVERSGWEVAQDGMEIVL